jgi:hypothetical protein
MHRRRGMQARMLIYSSDATSCYSIPGGASSTSLYELVYHMLHPRAH